MISNDNLDIFICCHKSVFNNPIQLTNKVYKIISPNKIKNKSKLEKIIYKENISNIIWSEFSHIKYLIDNYKFKDYVGICHYRRYFDFKDDISKIEGKEIVITKPEYTINNVINFGIYHSSKDLIEFVQFYNTLYKDNDYMKKIMKNYLNGCTEYTNNMVILSSKIFKEMMETVFFILLKWNENKNIKNINDLKQHLYDVRYDFLKDFSPNNSIDYQIRYYAYYGERLVSMFLTEYIKRYKENEIYISNKIISEKKYGEI